MAQQKQQHRNPSRQGQTGNHSSREQAQTADPDIDSTLEQVEILAAGAQESDDMDEEGLGEKLAELAVTSEEEVDALRINLLQEDERPDALDGSGLVVDDVAEERLARFTEADPMEDDLGAVSVEPGRDNTSAVLRRHFANTSIADSDAVGEGNLDEPMDETVTDRRVDEGSAG
jgi:hypothetical protein